MQCWTQKGSEWLVRGGWREHKSGGRVRIEEVTFSTLFSWSMTHTSLLIILQLNGSLSSLSTYNALCWNPNTKGHYPTWSEAHQGVTKSSLIATPLIYSKQLSLRCTSPSYRPATLNAPSLFFPSLISCLYCLTYPQRRRPACGKSLCRHWSGLPQALDARRNCKERSTALIWIWKRVKGLNARKGRAWHTFHYKYSHNVSLDSSPPFYLSSSC